MFWLEAEWAAIVGQVLQEHCGTCDALLLLTKSIDINW